MQENSRSLAREHGMRDISNVVSVGITNSINARDVGHEAAGAVSSETATVEANAHVLADGGVQLVGEAGEEGGALDAGALGEVDAEQVVLREGRGLGVLVLAAVGEPHERRDRPVLDRHVAPRQVRLPPRELGVRGRPHLRRVCAVHERDHVRVEG